MTDLVVINGQNVSFEVVGDQTYTTSLSISSVFEKEHKNILAKIDELPQDEFRELNFKLTERTAKFGAVIRSEPYYKITRDGFAMLVMGFTGERAYKFKVDFINAFNQMEKLLKSKSLSVSSELINELKNARCESDNLKNLNADLKDELICTQRELINFYKANEKDKKIKEYKLDEEKIFQIQDLYSQGISVSKIAKVVGVSDSSVRKYARRVQ